MYKSNSIAPSNTLGRNERLKSRKLIEELFSRGKALNAGVLRLVYLFSDAEQGNLQAGFSVSSRNFGKATDRNRIKRLMRECYRTQRHPLTAAVSEKKFCLSLFLIYTGKEIPDYYLIKENMNKAIDLLIKKVSGGGLK